MCIGWLIAGLLWPGCASTRTGQVAQQAAQCRDAFDVRVTLELSVDDRLQLRSSHPCPEVVLAFDREAPVRIFASDREANAWLALGSREALDTRGRAPRWNPNTMSVWVQADRSVRPARNPVEGPEDFLLFATRQPGGTARLTLISAVGEVVAEEQLGAGAGAQTGSYLLAVLLDVLTLPFVPFIILFGAMGG